MKHLQRIALYTLALFSAPIFAQLPATWTANPNGTLNFQTVTATGSFIAGSSEALSAFDMESGNLLWSNPAFAGIQEHQMEEVHGSPLLLIRQDNEVNILDPYDGKVKFNSKDAGFTELKFERMMFKTNGIMVAGTKGENEPSMMLIDLTTGKSRWEIGEKFGKLITAQEFSDSEMLVVALMNVYRINSKDGNVVWKKASSAQSEAMQDAGALGELFGGLTEQLAADVEFVMKYHEHPDKEIFVLASEVIKEIPPAGGTGSPTIVFENNYTAFKKSDGSRLWKDGVVMKGKLGSLAFHDNGVIILPDDGNNTLINYVDFASGEGQWGKKGKGTKIKGGVYSHVRTPEGLLLISGSGNNTFLNFLDPKTGELTFDKPIKVSGQVMRTFDSSKGLAFVTTDEFDILNTASGDLILDSSIPTQPGLVEQKGNDLYVFDTKKSIIRKVNLNDGSTTDITSDKLKFDGRESPQKLELRDNGILLTSDQNIALFSYAGEQQFSNYFKAPSESGLKKALLMAQAVRAAYIGANAYAAAGVLQSAAPQVSEEDAVGGALVEGFGMMYEELGNAASDFAKESLKRATSRFKATAEARDFLIVLAEVDKKNALLKVNKNTGEIDATIDLGKDKQPKYAVDDVSGKVFNQNADGAIVCYNL